MLLRHANSMSAGACSMYSSSSHPEQPPLGWGPVSPTPSGQRRFSQSPHQQSASSGAVLPIVGAIALLLGILFLGKSIFDGVSELRRGADRVSLRIPVRVTDADGQVLSNRLVIVFIERKEAARAYTPGMLTAELPRSVGAIGDELTLREGQRRPLGPINAQVTVYALAGDADKLNDSVNTNAVELASDGRLICPTCPPPVSDPARWLSMVWVGVILFVIVSLALWHLIPWPREVPWEIRLTGCMIASVAMTSAVVLMFEVTGDIVGWLYQVMAILRGAMNEIIGIFGVTVGWILLRAKIRAWLHI